MKCSGGFGALAGNAALPSATRPTDVPRVDVGQVDVWHVDVRDVYHVWHVDVRDVKVHVAGHARDVQIIEGCSQDMCTMSRDIAVEPPGGIEPPTYSRIHTHQLRP